MATGLLGRLYHGVSSTSPSVARWVSLTAWQSTIQYMGTVSVSSVELWQLLLLLNASNGQIQQLVICLCLCVCVFIYEHMSRITRPIFTNFLPMLPMAISRSSSGSVLYFQFYGWHDISTYAGMSIPLLWVMSLHCCAHTNVSVALYWQVVVSYPRQ